jgi:hypothetical protein
MTTKTTTHLTLARAASWLDRIQIPPALIIAVIILVVAAGISAFNRRAAQQVAAVPTPALPAIIIIASPIAEGPRPTPQPAAQVAAVPPSNVTRRAIVVYGAADLASAIGAVEAGRSYQVLAKHGADWLQVDISGTTGVVFVRTADLVGIPADLVDLAPAPAPQVIYVAAQPAAIANPEPPYEVTNAAPTLMPQQMVILDRQQWALDAQRAGR